MRKKIIVIPPIMYFVEEGKEITIEMMHQASHEYSLDRYAVAN